MRWETKATNLGWIWIRAAVFRARHLEPPRNLSSLWSICQFKSKIPEALRGNTEKSDPFFLSSVFITYKKEGFAWIIFHIKKPHKVWPGSFFYITLFHSLKTGESCWLILIFTSSGVISTGEKKIGQSVFLLLPSLSNLNPIISSP